MFFIPVIILHVVIRIIFGPEQHPTTPLIARDVAVEVG